MIILKHSSNVRNRSQNEELSTEVLHSKKGSNCVLTEHYTFLWCEISVIDKNMSNILCLSKIEEVDL